MTSSTHYEPPTSRMDRVFNSVVRWCVNHGVNLAGAQTLTVVGRKSGTPQTVPVNPMRLDGSEYLVSPRGNTQWVRNARAAGQVELRRGRRHRDVGVREVEPADRVPVIRAYLDRWEWEVKRFLPEGVSSDATDDQLRARVGDIPVFEVVAPKAAG